MPLPAQSVRAAPEHRDILRAVALLLRQGHEDELRRFLNDARERPVGPFRNEAAALGFLADRLVAALRPRMLWLFGSRARGDATPESDFDLMVVLPDGLPGRAYTPRAVAEPLVACGLGYDVIPCPWSVFEVKRHATRGIVATVVREGRVLHDSAVDPEPALLPHRAAA